MLGCIISLWIVFFAVATADSSTSSYDLPNTTPSLLNCLAKTPTFSCENITTIEDTCCSPTPGGLVLQTQFWHTYTGLEEEGQKLPSGSWTIHGLWPDNCDASYEQYCDLSRQYDPTPSPATLPDGTQVPVYSGPGVDTFVKEFGRDDQLTFMHAYWINQNAPNAVLWAHEFSKHATCTSTFAVACYANYIKNAEVIDYFDATIRAFAQYPTYKILASVGIVPSNTTSYTLNQFKTALSSQTGAVPFLLCNKSTILSEIWYLSHVYGTVQYGTYKTVDSPSNSSCSATEPIWYYERSNGSEMEVKKNSLA